MDAVDLERLRGLCLDLPGASERPSHGEPTWFASKRVFVMLSDHHHDGRVSISCLAPPGAQEALIDEAPERYFRPPYVGHRGWVGVYLDVEVDWDEIAELIEESYRLVATKRLVAELDARGAVER
jgi:predicted DNA-binding protein (MmcQ/YjbR family)